MGVNPVTTRYVSVTVALADLEGSAVLVAFTTTFCVEDTVAGAVYRPPAEMEPTPGLNDHVTPAVEPVTVAVNCLVSEDPNVEVSGATITLIGEGADD